ncbi:MAG: TonB-dependent receptor [Gammaproteobacteria bacterium]|nr:TonB-dependent receptor [Gammaproteobacteria bacterium]
MINLPCTRLAVLGCLPWLAVPAAATPELHDTLVVTASPIAGSLSDLGQSMSVISRAEIQSAPVDNLADLLQVVGGVDVRQRGGRGVQADVGIRGTAFEQTLVMIDGIRMSDPQTGHHAMNLPLPLEHIERIEVLKGPGSAAFGPGATGGAINLITRRPAATEAGLSVGAGEHGYRAVAGHLGLSGERSGHMVSASRRQADGHLSAEPTDFQLQNAYYSGHFDLGPHELRLGIGIDDREFGAYKFYVDRFPDQREETRTLTAQVSGDVTAGDWVLTPAVFWRQHEDWFRTRIPEFGGDFINEHETRVIGGRVGARRDWGVGVTALGLSLIDERIESTALGDHDRRERSVWMEHQLPVGERTRLSLSAAGVDFSDHDTVFLPGASVSFALRPDTTLFAAAARSARPPSYIERFLRGGAGNRGNPDLEPERSVQMEAGARWQDERQSLSAAVFQRRTDNLIDWSRPAPDVDFVSANFGGHRSRGAELEYRLRSDWNWLGDVRMGYTLLRTRLDAGDDEVAYALDHPRHHVTLTARFTWLPALEQSLQMRYVDRRGGGSAMLLASKLSWHWQDLTFSLEGSNLLDRDYIEAGFAPLPGRWLTAGVAWSM